MNTLFNMMYFYPVGDFFSRMCIVISIEALFCRMNINWTANVLKLILFCIFISNLYPSTYILIYFIYCSQAEYQKIITACYECSFLNFFVRNIKLCFFTRNELILENFYKTVDVLIISSIQKSCLFNIFLVD